MRQQQAALQPVHRGRNFQRGRSGRGGLRERQFVLVDVAERDDARQHHRVGVQLIEKDFPRHAPGAQGRQIERGLRQPCRIAPGLEAIDQSAIDQSGDDGAQERRGYWDAENAHELPDSGSAHHGMGFRCIPIEQVLLAWVVSGSGRSSGSAGMHCATSTPRWRGRPLPPLLRRRGFRHASTRRPAAGRTAAPVRWRGRTSWSAKIRRRARRRTATAT